MREARFYCNEVATCELKRGVKRALRRTTRFSYAQRGICGSPLHRVHWLFWGCVFSSSPLIKAASPDFAPAFVRKLCSGFFSLVFPDECRLCAQPLMEISRVPVCRTCLAKPSALTAEYFCVQCRSPFASRAPLDEQGRCALCRRGVRGFDAAYSFGFYEDALRELIHLFKYGRVQTLATPLGPHAGAGAAPRPELSISSCRCRCIGANAGSGVSINRNCWRAKSAGALAFR